MRVRILGAGAGGGVPQWNCGCAVCAAARAGVIPSLTQSSLAVSTDGETWVVVNASPDLRAQIAATPDLHPRGLRHSPIAAVILTNGDIDHVAGLLSLREGQPFDLWASEAVHATLAHDRVFGVMAPGVVRRRSFALGEPFAVAGLEITAFAVPGKVALYLEGETVETAALGEETVALDIRGDGRRVVYAPGCAAIPDWLVARVEGADLLLFDGTVWADDDMIRSGTGPKTGARMGHVAMSGPGGSLARLTGRAARSVYVHLNNTNPVLLPGPERDAILAAGWSIATDGEEFSP